MYGVSEKDKVVLCKVAEMMNERLIGYERSIMKVYSNESPGSELARGVPPICGISKGGGSLKGESGLSGSSGGLQTSRQPSSASAPKNKSGVINDCIRKRRLFQFLLYTNHNRHERQSLPRFQDAIIFDAHDVRSLRTLHPGNLASLCSFICFIYHLRNEIQ